MRCSHRFPAYLLLLAAFATPEALSAGAKVKFSHLTIDDGLPEAGAIAMIQDSMGFLWIGTQNGLVRYDGSDFVTYKPDPNDSSSLGGRLVLALYEDSNGELWVGTRRGGLNRYDRPSDSFVRFEHNPDDPLSLSSNAVGAIVEGHDGNLWVGTGDMEAPDGAGGLNLFDRSSGHFTRFQHDPADPNSLGRDVVMALMPDPSGLWIGTGGGGLDRMTFGADGTPTFTHFRNDPGNPESLSHDFVSSLAVADDGTLWVGTYAGLDRLEPGSDRFTHYRRDPTVRGGLASDEISELYLDGDGTLWIGTFEGVLHKLDIESDAIYRFEHRADDPGSFSASNWITAIFEDRTEILWVATWRGGLNKLDRFAARFPHYEHDPDNPNSLSADEVLAMTEDRAGSIWIGTRGGGLNRFTPRTDTFNHFRHDPDNPSSLGSDKVSSILQDRNGTLWIGTSRGLDRFNPDGGTFTHYRHDPNDPTSLSDSFVLSIFEDSKNRFWVGTREGGLNLMDTATGTFQAWAHDPSDTASIGHNAVALIYEDRAGTIWTACEGGLARFDPEAGVFTNYLEPLTGLDIVQSILEDRAGRLWVGTFNGGLHLFDRASGTSKPITEAHGLAHDAVYHILEDNSGQLWLATGNGLSRYDPGSGESVGTFRNYGVEDGLQGRRFNGGALLTQSGEMLFAGENGINAFYPEQVRDNPHPPEVALTGFELFNQPVKPASDAPLAQHVSVAEAVDLAHDENTISFSFAALHYGQPGSNRYAYRLEPLEKSWYETDYGRASYSNLAPDRYVFSVRAANGDGVWNEEGTSIAINVRPPWWQTWWAWTLYGLLAIVAVLSADRLQRRRLLARAKEQEAELRAEAAELQTKAAEAQAQVLQAENDRQTRELEDARTLQLSMLPETLPNHPDYEIAAHMKTATEVGGDYYDFDVAQDGTLTVAIGDATGHGARAGTMVTATKALFNALASEADGREVLEKSTRAIKRLNLQNLFMALALAKIRNGRLEIAGAGMPPTLILRQASGGVEELALNGAPLGSFTDFPYSSTSTDLLPGDTVLMMSDGLPETLDPEGEVFGYDRVGTALAGAASLAPQEVIEHLSRTAADWANGRPVDDDLTLVVLRRRPSAALA